MPLWVRRAGLYLGISLSTSLVATLATAPLIMNGFGQFNSYGILSNLLLGPLVEFWIMPLVVLCLVLLPLGIPQPVLWALGKGIGTMLALAEWVAGMPGAQLSVPPLTPLGLGLVVFGGCWMMLWRSGWFRALGLPAVLLGIALAWSQPLPQMLVSGDGKQLAARGGGGWAMLSGSSRNLRAKQWAERVAPQGFANTAEAGFECGLVMCQGKVGSRPLLVHLDPHPPRRYTPRSTAWEASLPPEKRAKREAARARASAKREEKERVRQAEIAAMRQAVEATCASLPADALRIDLRENPEPCAGRMAEYTRAEMAESAGLAFDEHGTVTRVTDQQGRWPWAARASYFSMGNR